jgi:hypothetical protein
MNPLCFKVILALCCAMLCIGGARALEVMADADLASVTGKDAAVFDMTFALNSNPTTGAQLGGCSGTVSTTFVGATGSFTNSACSMAVQFAGRTNEWLVLNGFSAYFKINGLKLDGVQLSAVEPSATTTKFNAASFVDPNSVNGTCLLLGGVTCNATNVGKLYALRFSPATASTLSSRAACSTAICPSSDAVYKDINMNITVTRASVLAGTSASAAPTNANPGNVVSIGMGDQSGSTISPLAKATWQGSVLIYGF